MGRETPSSVHRIGSLAWTMTGPSEEGVEPQLVKMKVMGEMMGKLSKLKEENVLLVAATLRPLFVFLC